MIKKDISRTS